MSRQHLALALLPLLIACAAPGTDPELEEREALSGRDPASIAADAPIEPHVSEGVLATHWDAIVQRHLASTPGRRFRLKEFHRSDRLSLAMIAVASSIPAPSTKQTELLIVIEGEQGALTMQGRRYRIGAGSVAVLPPGTRGEITAKEGDPLLGLLVTIKGEAPPLGTQPFLASFERLWGDEAFANNQDSQMGLVEVPGLLGLQGLTVYSYVPPRYHPNNEVLVLVLQGEGVLGLGTAGNIARTGSLALVPAETPYYYRNSDDRGTRLLVLNVPGLKADGTILIEGHPGDEDAETDKSEAR